jgi:hypothetical protein
LSLIAAGTHDEVMAWQLRERVARIGAALDTPNIHSGLREDAATEAARVVTARQLSSDSSPLSSSGAAMLTFVRRQHRRDAELRAFRLTFVDEKGHLEFETIVGVFADGNLRHLDKRGDLVAALHHERTLASLVMEVKPWLELARQREEAIADALRRRYGRLSAELLQPGLFDRRAERAAAAQAARMDEAEGRSRARLEALERLRRVRCGEHRLILGIRFLR